ncbi:hypothetical protein T484DRAFT_1806867 [Baffinella frigidus]|nr:hypothetical protein T484DRAFT_1806867 [Cryptophyta sp. CCMP2293]
MDSITKSPVFSLFAQAVDGVQTLRSMQQEEQVIEAMTSAIDANTGTYLSWKSKSSKLWHPPFMPTPAPTSHAVSPPVAVLEAMTVAIDATTGTYLSWAHSNRAHSNRWLGVRLDLMGAILIFLAALLAVLSPTVGAGGAGLLLTYAITITRTLAGSVRTSTAMEVQFNAVERVKHFSDLDSEPELEPGCKEQEACSHTLQL